MIYSSATKQEGFSLVEMLVAVSILLMVIVGPMTITTRASKSASFASEQVQAFFLAQEGLELAQMSRDNLLLENIDDPSSHPSPWSDFTNSGGDFQYCYTTAGCGLIWGDNTTVVVKNCQETDGCNLYFKDTGRSRFSYDSSGTKTPFTRKITFQREGANAVKVTSSVTWRTGSLTATQKVSVDTYLYNIYARP